MNKEQIYFPHYVNTRNDRRVKRLRKDMGLEGYGAFISLFEVLREQIDYRFPLSDIDLLSDEFGISEAKLKTIVMNYDLFIVDIDLKFFSVELIESIQPFLRAKEQRKNAIKARWDKTKVLEIQQETIRPYNDHITTEIQSKVNESKVNEIKEILLVDFQKNENLDSDLNSKIPQKKDKESLTAEKKERFDLAWALYDRHGNKKTSLARFLKLSDSEIENLFADVPVYKKIPTEIKYRKHFEVYINGKCWEDREIVKVQEKIVELIPHPLGFRFLDSEETNKLSSISDKAYTDYILASREARNEGYYKNENNIAVKNK
jgi:hypothetical protein